MAPALGESPLKQVNKAGQPKRSKLQASWDDLATNPQLFATDNSPLPTRYCSEFYCLRPNRTVQNAALAGISDGDLLGKYRTNVSELFIGGIKILKDAPPADVTRSNAVETLIPFLRHVFARNFSNKEQDVMTVLGGDAERHDQVFSDMVSALDATLRNVKVPVSVRHRVLQLALTLVACANQSPLTSYFLRRDLFSTLVAFIADDSTKQFAFESALLLGLLANYRKSEARNPYVVRIQDFVEEGIMERIIDVVSTVCSRARDSYVSISDDTPPSLVASLSSFVKSLRITEFLTGGFYLPPPPLPAPLNGQGGAQNSAAGSEDVKGKGKEEDVVEEKPDNEDAPKDESVALNGSGDASASTSSPASPTSPRKPPPPTISLPASPTSPTSRRPPLSTRSSSTSLKLRPEDAPFASMPPEMVVVLLAFYELLNSNKTFCSLVFGEREEGAPPSLPTELISLTSYIVSHASVTTHRARLYSRLCLIILLILVEEGEAKLSVAREEGEIRVCRQQQPMLPPRDPARAIPLSAMIDTVVIFLRHGLKKRLDVDTYTIALRLLQRIFQQLKTEKLRIARDWVIVWRAMLSLASFIVTHSVELRQNSGRLDTLISQLFITLSYAAYWGEQILPNSAAQARLHYELLHADETLDALSDLLGISSVATPSVTPPGSSNGSILPPLNRRDTPTRSTFFTLSQFSPTKSSFRSSSSLGVGTGGAGTGDGFVATECIANLCSSITFFSNHINALRLTKGAEDELEPDEILGVIERNLGGVELIESAAMGDLGRFAGEEIAGGFFEELVGVACEDTLRLLDAEQVAVPSSP